MGEPTRNPTEPTSIRIKWEPRDLWIGVFWDRREWVDWCGDPQCGDSTWDHYCDGSRGTGLVVYICLLPFLPVIFDFRPKGKDYYA